MIILELDEINAFTCIFSDLPCFTVPTKKKFTKVQKQIVASVEKRK